MGLILLPFGLSVAARCTNIQDELSEIEDKEMARMNVEISAAITSWSTLCGSDGCR